MNYGLTLKDARALTFELAKTNNLVVPDNWHTHKMAGRDWITAFLDHHLLSLRKPEGCSLARNNAFNKDNVNTFFSNLENVYKKYPSLTDGTRIYNLDETGLTTVGNTGRIIAQTGERQVAQVRTAELGSLVTACYIVSAAGMSLPPVTIFLRKNFIPRVTIGAPTGTLELATKSP